MTSPRARGRRQRRRLRSRPADEAAIRQAMRRGFESFGEMARTGERPACAYPAGSAEWDAYCRGSENALFKRAWDHWV